MKFTCTNELVTKMARNVSGALQRGTTPQETSQYMVLKVDGTNFSIVVGRPDFVAKVNVDAGLVPEGLFKILSEGKATINGQAFMHDLEAAIENDTLTLEFKKTTAPTVVKKADDDEESDKEPEVAKTGFVSVSRPAAKGMHELTKLHSVLIDVDPTIEVDTDSKVAFFGADFANFVKQVGISVGKPSMSVDYSNILIKTDGEECVMVTTNGQQLAKATFKAADSTKNISVVLPYDQVLTISKMCNHDLPVYMYVSGGANKTVVFAQDLLLDKTIVGRTVFKLRELGGKFVDFEPLIRSLSFVASCKIRTQELRSICAKLDIEIAKTGTIFDPEKGLIAFAKESSIIGKDAFLPITDAQGPRIEMFISSKQLSGAANVCPVEEIELRLSGATSLGLLVLSPCLSTYFMPFPT